MSRINPVDTVGRSASAHANFMAGPSWDVSNPVVRLRMAAASCFFGEPQYYHRDEDDKTPRRRPSRYDEGYLSDRDVKHLASVLDRLDPQEWRGLTPQARMESAIDAALSFDPAATLALAVELRKDWYIRVTPQVILVRAANLSSVKETGLVRQFAPGILQRPDEISTQLAYQLASFGKPIPNSLKKAWRDKLPTLSEYGLAKYRMGDRRVKTLDAVNLVHPKVTPQIDKLIRGTLSLDDNTWESLISREGSSTETWTRALDLMGHMALLRNIRNLVTNKVDSKLWVDKLIAGVADGQQLPFRYYSAFNANRSAPGPVQDAIEECLKRSFGNAPRFAGRVMSLCDNSGSACGTMTSSLGSMAINQIANLTAVTTGMLADEGYVGVFGDRLETFPVRKTASVFDQVAHADNIGRGIGGGTETGIWLFWDQAIRNAEHWDTVFVYSDMQAGHGGLYGRHPHEYKDYRWFDGRCIDVPALISAYRTKVNPNVQVFLVQVAGYQDTIVPETYKGVYVLGGWGDGILKYAAAMLNRGNDARR